MLQRGATALALTTLATGAAITLGTGSAEAATPRMAGTITQATQDTWHHVLRVQGLAWSPGHQGKSLRLSVFVNGHLVGHVNADRASKRWARQHHIRGEHAFSGRFHVKRVAHRVAVLVDGTHTGGLVRNARHVRPKAGTRILEVAKRFVGRAPYVYGGSSPRGFDCSGYVKYAYGHAHVRTLPHNAEAQRHVRGMHRIARNHARPGDLVFYLSGGTAYHVALYIGHGRQYSAADPQEGIKRQKIWSHNVEFMTVTH